MLDGTLWPFEDPALGTLQRGHYRTLLVDPPWAFLTRSAKGKGKSPDQHYSCMSLADIKALPVADLAHPDGCSLICWTFGPFGRAAMDVVEAWGFQFCTMGAWGKLSKRSPPFGQAGAKLHISTGYTWRGAAEFWLYATRGRPGGARVHDVRNLMLSPVREHSRKPDQMRLDLERMFPGPRAELFARAEAAEGWDLWGNEVGKLK